MLILPMILAVCAALAAAHTVWPCACLLCWMARRRRIPIPARSPIRTLRCRRSAKISVTAANVRPPHWRSKPEWACKEVIYYAMHGRSCRWIETTFNRRHGAYATVGHSWVAEYIKEHAAAIAERRRAMRRRPPRFFAVGHTWALDLTFLIDAQGLTFAVLGLIDQGSRRLLCLEHLPRKCTLTLLGHLFLTMAAYGVPATIRTDNEAMFRSALWKMMLAALGICHRRSQLGCPWQNGRIERLFGTLKALFKQVQPQTAQALRSALHEFTWFYNHVPVHQSLNGLTPMEAWHGKTLADVQQAHAQGTGRWVQALEGRLVGYHVRC